MYITKEAREHIPFYQTGEARSLSPGNSSPGTLMTGDRKLEFPPAGKLRTPWLYDFLLYLKKRPGDHISLPDFRSRKI